MDKESKFIPKKGMADVLACGRDLAEQVEDIRRYGNHGASSILRSMVLAAFGIRKPKSQAENGILFGCYRPFTTPFLLRDYIRLLDLLGVDYTYFEKEYCCGLPLVMQSEGEDQESGRTFGVQFHGLNLNLARDKDVHTMAYCCVGWAYMAKASAGNESGNQVYILDLILDKLQQTPLKVGTTRIGYFEGCHTFYSKHFPQVNLGWEKYRRFFGTINGPKIVDLPNKFCCKRSADRIMECL